jgi:hypothetical protein
MRVVVIDRSIGSLGRSHAARSGVAELRVEGLSV